MKKDKAISIRINSISLNELKERNVGPQSVFDLGLKHYLECDTLSFLSKQKQKTYKHSAAINEIEAIKKRDKCSTIEAIKKAELIK